MTQQLTRTSTRDAAPIAKHMAFALIGAAIILEAFAASAILASGDSMASLLTAEPVYRAHFAMVAAYSSVSDYASQLLGAFDVTSVAHSVAAFGSEKLNDLLSFQVQLGNRQIDIVLIGR